MSSKCLIRHQQQVVGYLEESLRDFGIKAQAPNEPHQDALDLFREKEPGASKSHVDYLAMLIGRLTSKASDGHAYSPMHAFAYAPTQFGKNCTLNLLPIIMPIIKLLTGAKIFLTPPPQMDGLKLYGDFTFSLGGKTASVRDVFLRREVRDIFTARTVEGLIAKSNEHGYYSIFVAEESAIRHPEKAADIFRKSHKYWLEHGNSFICLGEGLLEPSLRRTIVEEGYDCLLPPEKE